jgi:beta-glucosidase
MDIGNSFLDENGKISVDIMHDLLHPTAKGYQLFAQAIEPEVKELLSE